MVLILATRDIFFLNKHGGFKIDPQVPLMLLLPSRGRA